MKNIRLLLAIAFTAGFAIPAFGDCDGKPSALSDFGAADLGDTFAKVPRDVTRLPGCMVFDGKPNDCELLDRSGVSYLVFDGLITRKNIRISPQKSLPRLPFGLLSTDTIGQVVKKISPRSDAPDLYILYRDQKILLFSGLCVTNKLGVEFAIEFVFGADEKLQQMSVLEDSSAN